MCTQHKTLYSELNSGKDETSAVFETRDFYLACFLRSIGYELLDLGADGRRRVFRFRDTAHRRCDVMAFYSDHATVPPLAYSSTIKEMKALLHNA